ncbi:MAG: ATP-binding cassette domain-containing protein, partial [Alphaproteobacteria bacterium]|nr:ATP-binding cassette domain-containing protein [Alphaproteobacteria bacterium]
MTRPLLRVDGLMRSYYGVRAVDGLSFEVARGSITGLIGPNGSGKSTTIDCVTGFQPADGGRWTFDGVELTGARPHVVARAGLTRTFQNVRAFEQLSLRDNLLQAAQAADGVGWVDAWVGTRRLRAAAAAAGAEAMR